MPYKIERTGQKNAKNNNGWTRLSTINSDFKGMKIELQKSRYCFDVDHLDSLSLIRDDSFKLCPCLT